jgi:hypothetical protein
MALVIAGNEEDRQNRDTRERERERELLVAALIQAMSVNCLGHTTSRRLEALKIFYQYDIFSFSEPSMETLIGSK